MKACRVPSPDSPPRLASGRRDWRWCGWNHSRVCRPRDRWPSATTVSPLLGVPSSRASSRSSRCPSAGTQPNPFTMLAGLEFGHDAAQFKHRVDSTRFRFAARPLALRRVAGHSRGTGILARTARAPRCTLSSPVTPTHRSRSPANMPVVNWSSRAHPTRPFRATRLRRFSPKGWVSISRRNSVQPCRTSVPYGCTNKNMEALQVDTLIIDAGGARCEHRVAPMLSAYPRRANGTCARQCFTSMSDLPRPALPSRSACATTKMSPTRSLRLSHCLPLTMSDCARREGSREVAACT
jgi:hypothetical protein